MKPKAGHDYLQAAAHFAAESSTGTNVEVCTTDDFTRGVDALVYLIDEASEEMRIAYPIDLFDRNITDGRMMIVSFLTLVIGNNQGMGDIEHAKIYDFYMPERALQLFDGPAKDISDLWRILGRPTQGWWLHRRHDHQTQARPAAGAVCQGRLSVLARGRLHQERRTPGQPGVCPDEEGHAPGVRRDEAGAG
jgi:hypothetical protein